MLDPEKTTTILGLSPPERLPDQQKKCRHFPLPEAPFCSYRRDPPSNKWAAFPAPRQQGGVRSRRRWICSTRQSLSYGGGFAQTAAAISTSDGGPAVLVLPPQLGSSSDGGNLSREACEGGLYWGGEASHRLENSHTPPPARAWGQPQCPNVYNGVAWASYKLEHHARYAE